MLGNINLYVASVQGISQHDDDSVDRLTYKYTAVMLLALSLMLFAKNYVGEPLQCWVPKQFTEVWEAFSERYCFIENTYFVPMNDTNMPEASTRESREMIYYQWVPFILILMAFFFVLPRFIWSFLSTYSGLAISDLMSSARKSSREMVLASDLIGEVARRVNNKKIFGEANTHVKYGANLFNGYIVMKVCILINVVLQFTLLNNFLGTSYTLWGLGILWDMAHGRHWQASGHFPRVAFCDVNVRELGNVNHWTVQCVLMVNMFNEKIFIFLWFWLLILFVATLINVVIWLRRRFSPASRKEFVAELLADADIHPEDTNQRNFFYQTVLKDDGVLLLRLLDANGGRLQSCELVSRIWDLTYAPGFHDDVFSGSLEEWKEPYPSQTHADHGVVPTINSTLGFQCTDFFYDDPLLQTRLRAQMSQYLKLLVNGFKFGPTYDVDSVDRLKYFYTVTILSALATFILSTQYVGQSVQCWAPSQFAGGWEAYAEQYCLIENTYFVPMNGTNLPPVKVRENSQMRYYQWVPFLLVGMATALYLPKLVWKFLQSFGGINVSNVTVTMRKNAKQALGVPADAEMQLARATARRMQGPKRSRTDLQWGAKMTFCLLASKLLSLLVVISSFVFINVFMDLGAFYGFTIVADAIRGREWHQSGKFPRVTFCDFEIRELATVQRWSLQCVLMVNMFNEKIFVFLWWWFAILLVASVVDISSLILRFNSTRQNRIVENILKTYGDTSNLNSDDVANFTRDVLKTDGVNLLQLIVANSTIFQAAEFVRPFWEEYQQRSARVN